MVFCFVLVASKTLKPELSTAWQYCKIECAPPMTVAFFAGSGGAKLERVVGGFVNKFINALESQIKQIDENAAKAKRLKEEKIKAEQEKIKAEELKKRQEAAKKAEEAKKAKEKEAAAKAKEAEAKKAATEKKEEPKKPKAKKPEKKRKPRTAKRASPKNNKPKKKK